MRAVVTEVNELIRAERKAYRTMRRQFHKLKRVVDAKDRFNPTALEPRLEACNQATVAYLEVARALNRIRR